MPLKAKLAIFHWILYRVIISVNGFDV